MRRIYISVGPVGKEATVLLDGKDISDVVSAVSFNAGAGEKTEVAIVLVPDRVEISTVIEPGSLTLVKKRNVDFAKALNQVRDWWAR